MRRVRRDVATRAEEKHHAAYCSASRHRSSSATQPLSCLFLLGEETFVSHKTTRGSLVVDISIRLINGDHEGWVTQKDVISFRTQERVFNHPRKMSRSPFTMTLLRAPRRTGARNGNHRNTSSNARALCSFTAPTIMRTQRNRIQPTMNTMPANGGRIIRSLAALSCGTSPLCPSVQGISGRASCCVSRFNHVSAVGTLIGSDTGSMYLADVVLLSFPPQLGSGIEVRGISRRHLEGPQLQSAGDRYWVDDVVASGTVEEGVLTAERLRIGGVPVSLD